MIQVYKHTDDEGESTWHLVRSLRKSGMSIRISTYCGQEAGATEVQQIPSAYMPSLCEKCRGAYSEVLGNAP